MFNSQGLRWILVICITLLPSASSSAAKSSSGVLVLEGGNFPPDPDIAKKFIEIAGEHAPVLS